VPTGTLTVFACPAASAVNTELATRQGPASHPSLAAFVPRLPLRLT